MVCTEIFEDEEVTTPKARRAVTERQKPYPVDTTELIESLTRDYRVNGRPVTVSFRQLVPWMKVGERATHYLHHYPAKLLPQIAHFFLASQTFCPLGGVVLDPFGGTGTVALETILSGRLAAYADTNPLARLIAEAKTNPPDRVDWDSVFLTIESKYKLCRKRNLPDVVNLEKWFTPTVIGALVRLRFVLCNEFDGAVRTFLLVTFSASLRKVSNADPRLSVPVMSRPGRPELCSEDVFSAFADQFRSNVKRLASLSAMGQNFRSFDHVGRDARKISRGNGGELDLESVDLIITSPPYAGAQKYIRASSLSLGWLGLAGARQLKPLENATIGREHLTSSHRLMDFGSTSGELRDVLERIQRKNPIRAAICFTYIREMEEALFEASAVLKVGGFFILVIGNNEVCGEQFWSSRFLTNIMERAGFAVELELVDEIKSRGLMTKRNRSASVISTEWVIIFRKVTNADCSGRAYE